MVLSFFSLSYAVFVVSQVKVTRACRFARDRLPAIHSLHTLDTESIAPVSHPSNLSQSIQVMLTLLSSFEVFGSHVCTYLDPCLLLRRASDSTTNLRPASPFPWNWNST
jgi:hypothetical protein